jgi:uncharacterized membrane protein YphA (DoxX/SURF4 family)
MYIIEPAAVLLFGRIVLGIVMLYYGWPKIRALQSNAHDFIRMGFRPGWVWGSVVAFNEFVGGAALVIGFWPELFAAAIAFEMLLGTFWKIKIGKPFSDFSYDLLALALAGILMRFGGGLWVAASAPFVTWARWDLALGALAVAGVMAIASKPRMT